MHNIIQLPIPEQYLIKVLAFHIMSGWCMQVRSCAKPLHVALAQNKQERQRKARQAMRARAMTGDASSDRVSFTAADWMASAVKGPMCLTDAGIQPAFPATTDVCECGERVSILMHNELFVCSPADSSLALCHDCCPDTLLQASESLLPGRWCLQLS